MAIKINDLVDICDTQADATMNATRIFKATKKHSSDNKYTCTVIRAAFIAFTDVTKASEYDAMSDEAARTFTNNRKAIIESIGHSYRRHIKFDEWNTDNIAWESLAKINDNPAVKKEPGAAAKRDRQGQVNTTRIIIGISLITKSSQLKQKAAI